MNQSFFERALRHLKIENRKQVLRQEKNEDEQNEQKSSLLAYDVMNLGQQTKCLSRLCTKTYLWQIGKMFDDDEKRFLLESVMSSNGDDGGDDEQKL